MRLASVLTPRGVFALAVLVLCAAVPVLAPALGQPYYVDVFARMMIWSIAAISLNLILGYGGMISFGHAVYLGIGGYTVGICAFYGVDAAWIQWPLALAISAAVAFVFGAISLRTRGVYFIMITLALAQMIYYLSVSAEEYGSDDGLVIYDHSDLGVDWISLGNTTHLYYLIFAVMLLSLFVAHRIVNSRFGMVIRGARSNEARMEAMGFSTYRYRLVAFVIAGVMCAMAGVLSANLEGFVSPDMMWWPKSGQMIFMVVLGGMGTLFGPVAGALVYWLLSEILTRLMEQWHLVFGPFLVLAVLFARRGIDGLFDLGRRRHG